MMIRKFDQISKEDVEEVGGKAASLGEMTNFGISVPGGFVVTTEGYLKDVEKEALRAFDQLVVEKVAVRSSAVSEDSVEESWAGQLETYLNISREDLMENIKKCWESVNSERVLAYGGEKDKSKVAVVVQKMIDAKAAGVMFTANPVTNNRKEIMIESVLGLGEQLVQGDVTPDNFIIDKVTGEIKDKDLQNAQQTISDETINELVNLGKKIEDHYSKPQDIEWAIDKEDKIWILQSRPITTLD